MALQALSEYAIWSNGERVNLRTTITTDVDSSFNHTVHLHPGNALLQQSIQVRSVQSSPRLLKHANVIAHHPKPKIVLRSVILSTLTSDENIHNWMQSAHLQHA